MPIEIYPVHATITWMDSISIGGDNPTFVLRLSKSQNTQISRYTLTITWENLAMNLCFRYFPDSYPCVFVSRSTGGTIEYTGSQDIGGHLCIVECGEHSSSLQVTTCLYHSVNPSCLWNQFHFFPFLDPFLDPWYKANLRERSSNPREDSGKAVTLIC